MLPGMGSFYFSCLNRKAKNEQCIICSSRKTLFPFDRSLSFIDRKNNFHYNLFNKIDHFGCSCAGRSCINISQGAGHKSSSGTVNQYLSDSRTNLQGQYLFYKTMQHYRISIQRSNSLNQHQQVVTKCKVISGTRKIYTEMFVSEKHLSFQTSCRDETSQKQSFTCGYHNRGFTSTVILPE